MRMRWLAGIALGLVAWAGAGPTSAAMLIVDSERYIEYCEDLEQIDEWYCDRRDAPGAEGSFSANIPAPYSPYASEYASQDSQVGPTALTGTLFAYKDFDSLTEDSTSKFRVVFELDAPVAYELTVTQNESPPFCEEEACFSKGRGTLDLDRLDPADPGVILEEILTYQPAIGRPDLFLADQLVGGLYQLDIEVFGSYTAWPGAGLEVGFSFIPVPEPAPLACLALALTSLAVGRRRLG